jgi:hypothetical protein
VRFVIVAIFTLRGDGPPRHGARPGYTFTARKFSRCVAIYMYYNAFLAGWQSTDMGIKEDF